MLLYSGHYVIPILLSNATFHAAQQTWFDGALLFGHDNFLLAAMQVRYIW